MADEMAGGNGWWNKAAVGRHLEKIGEGRLQPRQPQPKDTGTRATCEPTRCVGSWYGSTPKKSEIQEVITLAHSYKLNDNVHHQSQGPQGRAEIDPPMIYTIVQRMPIEADGRLRYRIKSKSTNVERVVTEDQLSYSQ